MESLYILPKKFSYNYVGIIGVVKSNRQPTLLLHNLCLEVLTVHGNVLRLFTGQDIFPTLNICVSSQT